MASVTTNRNLMKLKQMLTANRKLHWNSTTNQISRGNKGSKRSKNYEARLRIFLEFISDRNQLVFRLSFSKRTGFYHIVFLYSVFSLISKPEGVKNEIRQCTSYILVLIHRNFFILYFSEKASSDNRVTITASRQAENFPLLLSLRWTKDHQSHPPGVGSRLLRTQGHRGMGQQNRSC